MTSSVFSSRGRPALYALGRGLFLLLLVVLTASLFAGRARRAEAGRRLIGAGAALLRFWDGAGGGLGTTLHVNGRRIAFASGREDVGVTAMLDRVEAGCPRGEGAAPLPRALRDEAGGRGYVACLAGERGAYVYVEAREGGVRWMSVALDGRAGVLDVAAMFPAEGDAPGIDLGGVPRPAGSRRILSSFADGHPYALAMYRRPAAGGDVAEAYRGELERAGWTPVGAITGDGEARSFAAARGRRWISVTVVPDRGGAATVVVLGDHGGNG